MPGPGQNVDFFAGDAAMTITQISRASLLPKDKRFALGPGAAAQVGPDGRLRDRRPGRHRRAAVGQERGHGGGLRGLHDQSGEFGQAGAVLPLGAQVAAQRRSARQDLCPALAGATRPGRGRGHRQRQGDAGPHRLRAPAADGARRPGCRCGQPEGRRPGRDATICAQHSAPAARDSKELRRGSRDAPRSRCRAAGGHAPAVLDRSRGATAAAGLSLRRAATDRHHWSSCWCRSALVFWYSLHEWNVLANTFTFTGTAGTTKKLLFERPVSLPGVLRRLRRCSRRGLVLLNMGLALLLAVLLNQKLAGIALFRTLFFSPVVVSLVAWTIVWGFLLQAQRRHQRHARRLLGIDRAELAAHPRHRDALGDRGAGVQERGAQHGAVPGRAAGRPARAVRGCACIDGATRWQAVSPHHRCR